MTLARRWLTRGRAKWAALLITGGLVTLVTASFGAVALANRLLWVDEVDPSPSAPVTWTDKLPLAEAEAFATSAIGPMGRRSAYASRFHELLKSRAAERELLRLVEQGTPAGQLYGLCGLYQGRPSVFEKAVANMAASQRKVLVVQGCFGQETTVSGVLRAPGGHRSTSVFADICRTLVPLEILGRGIWVPVPDEPSGSTVYGRPA